MKPTRCKDNNLDQVKCKTERKGLADDSQEGNQKQKIIKTEKKLHRE